MFTPASRPAGPRNRVELNRVNCGDGLERRPLVGIARERETPPMTLRPASVSAAGGHQ